MFEEVKFDGGIWWSGTLYTTSKNILKIDEIVDINILWWNSGLYINILLHPP